MNTCRFFSGSSHRRAAFSLVEIALALGIIGFALVGIVGALPVAMNNGRLSIAQSRAASLANTMFASFRAQPFNSVQYADVPITGTATTAPLNLNSLKTDPKSDSPLTTCYAYFDEVVQSVPTLDARRLHIVGRKEDIPEGALYYVIVLRFDNDPSFLVNKVSTRTTLPPYQLATGGTRAQVNAVEASIYEATRTKDVFHFTSLIANRLN